MKIKTIKIKSIKKIGERNTYDIEVPINHNFFLANGILTHNSGKGQLIKLMEKVLKKLDISFARQTKFHSTSLIGTINESAVIYNKQHKFDEENPKYIDPRVYGDLYYFDVLIFPEAKKMLLEGMDKGELLEDLQEAMDYPGLIRKKLKWDVILDYTTDCSFYCTTYYAKEISTNLLYKGFYQRLLLYMRILTPEETISLRHKVIDMYQKNLQSKNNFELEIDEFVSRIKEINNTPRIMELTPDAIKFLHQVMERYGKKLNESQGEELTILKSFSQTIIDITVKIGAIHSLVSGKTNLITDLDLNVALKFAQAALDTVVNKLEIKIEQKGYKTPIEDKIIGIFKLIDNGKITRTLLIDECLQRQVSVRKNQIYKTINRMITEQVFKDDNKGEKNSRFLRLNTN